MTAPSVLDSLRLDGKVAIVTDARPGSAPGYVASEAGLIGLTRELAVQWTEREGIRVNALVPSGMGRGLGEDERALISERILSKRFRRLEELTPALLLLASDASSYMTGTTLAVDGGLSMH